MREINKNIEELKGSEEALLNMTEDLDETNKKLLETQKKLKISLRELKKLDFEKDEFISVAAHELKTPMTAIHGFSQLLENEKIIKNKETRDRYLKIIKEEVERLSRLVTDVLDLSRADLGALKFTIEEVDIAKLLEETRNELLSKIKEKGLKLNVNIGNDLPTIMADREKLKQILINLIGNSLKFTEKGSIDVEVRRENNNVKFSVADTGIGIAKKDFGKVFKRFSQLESAYTRKVGGTGLGLSICKEMIKAMNGDIWFESRLGKGSKFSFLLPIKTGGKLKEDKYIKIFKSLEEKGIEPTRKEKIGQMVKKGFITKEGKLRGVTSQELEKMGYVKIDYEKVITILIEKMEKILGPMSFEAAKTIDGIKILKDNKIIVTGDGREVLDDLISNYEEFLGPLGKVLADDEIKKIILKKVYK